MLSGACHLAAFRRVSSAGRRIDWFLRVCPTACRLSACLRVRPTACNSLVYLRVCPALWSSCTYNHHAAAVCNLAAPTYCNLHDLTCPPAHLFHYLQRNRLPRRLMSEGHHQVLTYQHAQETDTTEPTQAAEAMPTQAVPPP